MKQFLSDILGTIIENIALDYTYSNAVLNAGFVDIDLNKTENLFIGANLLINNRKYEVLNIINKTLTLNTNNLIEIQSYSNAKLSINFFTGTRIELNNILTLKSKTESERFKKYPFIWLVTDYKETAPPTELKDLIDYEVNPVLVFVDETRKNYLTTERITNTFKKSLTNILNLFLTEINKTYATKYFHKYINNEFLTEKTDRFFYGSQDKNKNVFSDSYTDAIETIFEFKVLKNKCLT